MNVVPFENLSTVLRVRKWYYTGSVIIAAFQLVIMIPMDFKLAKKEQGGRWFILLDGGYVSNVKMVILSITH